MEAEGVFFSAGRQPPPIVEGCLQQREGADDVGLDEGGRAVDGAIDMAFGREMHDGIRLEALDHAAHLGRIDDVGADERIAGAVRYRRQRFEVAGIGELVDDQNGVAAVADRMADHCRADEAGTAGDEDAARHGGESISVPELSVP